MSSKTKKHHNKSRAEHNREVQNRNRAVKPVHKERGFWLMLVLVLMAVHGIAAAYFYSTAKMGATPNAHTWVLSLMVAHSLLNIIAVVGIWFWQKWALYVYAVSTVLALIAGLMTGYGMYSSFYVILPVAILGWLLRTKWDYFK